MSGSEPRVEVVLPVYNEERALAASVEILVDHLRREFPFPWRVTIADNASVDETPLVGARLRPPQRVARERRRRRLVHGRRPLDEPRELPAARGAAPLRAQRGLHRHPALSPRARAPAAR